MNLSPSPSLNTLSFLFLCTMQFINFKRSQFIAMEMLFLCFFHSSVLKSKNILHAENEKAIDDDDKVLLMNFLHFPSKNHHLMMAKRGEERVKNLKICIDSFCFYLIIFHTADIFRCYKFLMMTHSEEA